MWHRANYELLSARCLSRGAVCPRSAAAGSCGSERGRGASGGARGREVPATVPRGALLQFITYSCITISYSSALGCLVHSYVACTARYGLSPHDATHERRQRGHESRVCVRCVPVRVWCVRVRVRCVHMRSVHVHVPSVHMCVRAHVLSLIHI